MYIVRSGLFSVINAQGIPFAQIRSNEYIADKSLIVNSPERSTVKALEESIVYLLNKNDFITMRRDIAQKISNTKKQSKKASKAGMDEEEKREMVSVDDVKLENGGVFPEDSAAPSRASFENRVITYDDAKVGCQVWGNDNERVICIEDDAITGNMCIQWGRQHRNKVPIPLVRQGGSSHRTKDSKKTPTSDDIGLIPAAPLTPLTAPLQADYIKHTALQKQELLWKRLSKTPYTSANLPTLLDPSTGWNAVNPSYLVEMFTLETDEVAKGRKKALNSFGSAAKVTFKILSRSKAKDAKTTNSARTKFTGLFQTGGPGIVRFSLAKLMTSPEESFRPAIALKMLIKGKPSVNIFAAGVAGGLWSQGTSGSRQPNCNFFAYDLSTAPATSSHSTQVPLWMLPRRTRPTTWEKLSLNKAGAVTCTGEVITDSANSHPVKLFFVPDPDIADFYENGDGNVLSHNSEGYADVTGKQDFRAQLATIPAGAVLYNVFAWSTEDDTSGPGELIGMITLESPIVASKYGDEHLFFQHPLN